jgi:glycogen debranching enzyme
VSTTTALGKLVLMDGPTFVVSDESGDLGADDPADGLYHHDTRFLSAYRVLLNDAPLAFLSAPQADSATATVHSTNQHLLLPDGTRVLPQTIALRRTRYLRDGLHERLELISYNRFPVPFRLTLRVAADFRDMFDIRGFARAERGRLMRPRRRPDGVELRYRGLDGVPRTTRISTAPSFELSAGVIWDTTVPSHETVTLPDATRVVDEPEQHLEEVELVLSGELRPQEPYTVTILVEPREEESSPEVAPGDEAAARFEVGREAAEAQRRNWLERSVTRFDCSSPALGRLLARGADDLYMLTQWPPTGPVPVAGIPWFASPFGRDSIITALEALPLVPDLAAGTLRFLAQHQGACCDDWRDEEPGKIMHELRQGELARLGAVPFAPYYGSVDATPLFLILFGEAARWLGGGLVDELWPHAERALEWVERWGDLDGDGLIEYRCRSPVGIRNQGWKDSDDSVTHVDGTLAEPPIALIEVQAYAHAGMRAMAELYRRRGDPARAEALEGQARELSCRVRERFWLPELGVYALALDREKRPVAVVSSNAAHALFGGLAGPEEAAALVQRLARPDVLSGWGLRTLSAGAPSFNPMSYHNGSIWPHDNALAVAGLMRYGHTGLATEVFEQVFAAAQGFRGLRLPELYCGFGREGQAIKVPAAYPVSCSPQAWAAGAPFLMLSALLGLEPEAAAGRITLRPRLPEWLEWLRVDGLCCGQGRASFRLVREREGRYGLDVLAAEALDVVLAPAPTAVY